MARRPKNRLLDWLNTWSIITFCKLMAVLPIAVSRGIGRWAGYLAYYLVPKVRRVGLANQTRAYGNSRSRKQKARTVRRCAASVGTVAAEFARTAKLDRKRIETLISFEGLENLDLSNGVILIGAHLGNWEWMVPALRMAHDKVAVVVQGVKDPRLNRFIDETRSATGARTVPKHGCGPELARLLKDGWIVGILIDQSPRDSGAPAVFLGEPCWATIGPAMLAARTNAPVHTVSIPRDEHGHYTLRFSPPLELIHTGNLLDDLHENTQRCQNAIEELVLEHPDQWLWFHRRWKRRPKLEQEWQQRQERERAVKAGGPPLDTIKRHVGDSRK